MICCIWGIQILNKWTIAKNEDVHFHTPRMNHPFQTPHFKFHMIYSLYSLPVIFRNSNEINYEEKTPRNEVCQESSDNKVNFSLLFVLFTQFNASIEFPWFIIFFFLFLFCFRCSTDKCIHKFEHLVINDVL